MKRVHVRDGIMTLISDNGAAYPPMPIQLKSTGSQTLQKILVGRVRWIGHEED